MQPAHAVNTARHAPIFPTAAAAAADILAQKIFNLLHFHMKQSHIYLCSCVHTKRQHCFTPVGTFPIYHVRRKGNEYKY
jgi:hypothetical protein